MRISISASPSTAVEEGNDFVIQDVADKSFYMGGNQWGYYPYRATRYSEDGAERQIQELQAKKGRKSSFSLVNLLDFQKFPAMGNHGLEGSNSTTFISSPSTASAFVKHLRTLSNVTAIYTGRRGREYQVNWDGGFVDVASWKAAHYSSSK